MLSNLLYLIDTQSIELMVSLFIMTVNNSGNIILRFVAEQGPLSKLEKFNTNDAYLAVKEVEYQSENSEFVKSVLPKYAKKYIVATTIFDEKNVKDLKPFGISILKNKMTLKRPKINPISDNDSVVLATINSASVKASNNIATIILGDKNNCTYFEFYQHSDSIFFDNSRISLERRNELVDIEVIKEKKQSIFGDTIKYINNVFDEKWRKQALVTLEEFFLDDEVTLIPRLDALWYEDYIEGKSFPYWIIGGTGTKKDWIKFLSDSDNFPVDLRKFLKAS